jgi:hypothetical protein
MMEWQRIVRHRRHLQKFKDIHGKPIYSDEQMVTYLKQFERDFTRATQTVLDATEGGIEKAGTKITTLSDALFTHATRPVPALPTPDSKIDPARLDAAVEVRWSCMEHRHRPCLRRGHPETRHAWAGADRRPNGRAPSAHGAGHLHPSRGQDLPCLQGLLIRRISRRPGTAGQRSRRHRVRD